MSSTLYMPCPTSNDLLSRLIAKQAALNYKTIVPNADDDDAVKNRKDRLSALPYPADLELAQFTLAAR